jgi:Carboxypeptidase regulatory-like domain
MRSSFSAVLLMPLLVSLLAAQNGIYKISGTVVQSATNEPLPKVLVQITSTQQRNASQSVITDNNGNFSFMNLAPGKYSLAASRSGSDMQLYQGEEGFSTAIVAGPGLDSEHVIFPLRKLGSISGTIFDEQGDGVRGAQVYLYWQHVASGRMEVAGRGSQGTKSSGQFHFGHLQDGTYYLAVQAHPWYAQSILPPVKSPADAAQSASLQQFDVAYPLTYYTDAADVSSATPITVNAGETAKVQMTLRPVPAVHIRLPNVETKPGAGLQTMVYALGPAGQRIAVNPAFRGPGNSQELAGIAPGRYEVSMQAFENGHQQALGTKVMDLQNGSQVDLSSVSRLSLSGRIQFEGKPRPPDPVTLHVTRPDGGMFVQAPIAADGTFQVENQTLSPGRYRLGLENAAGFRFQSVLVKGGKWKDGLLELSEGSNAQVSIIASAISTKLDGTALRDGKPVGGAMVLLLPEDPDHSDLIRRDQSDSDGTFTLPNVSPGRYRLLAIDNGHGLAYKEAAVIKPYLPLSQAITVSAEKQPPLKVNVQARLP